MNNKLNSLEESFMMYKSQIHLFFATILKVKMKLNDDYSLNLYTLLKLFSIKDNELLIKNTWISYDDWITIKKYFMLHSNDYNMKFIDQDLFDNIPRYLVKLEPNMTDQLVDICRIIKYLYFSKSERIDNKIRGPVYTLLQNPEEIKIYNYKKDLRHYIVSCYLCATDVYGANKPLYYDYKQSFLIFLSTRITCNNWINLFNFFNVIDYSKRDGETYIKDKGILKEHFEYLRQFMVKDEENAVNNFVCMYLN